MRRLVQPTFLQMLLCILIIVVSLPSRSWSFAFEDQFDDGDYSDKWTLAVAGQGSVTEYGTVLDVEMSPQPGACTTVVLTQKGSYGFTCSMEASVVLKPAEGASAGVKVRKDENNFMQLVIGPEDLVIENMESGRLAAKVVGSAASYIGKNTTVTIGAGVSGGFTLSVNGAEVGKGANMQMGSNNLSLELSSSYCPSAASTAHTYYDSAIVKTISCRPTARVSGRVTDSQTGEGVSFAAVSSDLGGGGVTSPNGYYMVGTVENHLDITVAAFGYSPAWGTVDISGLVTIRDWSLKPVCPAVITPEGAVYGTSGGSGGAGVVMTPQAGCGMDWLAENSAAWISLPGGSGIVSGDKWVTYLIAPNAGIDPRTGTISLAGQTFRIVQQGTQQMAVPGAAQVFEYPPVADPVLSVDSSAAHPFASGNLPGGKVDMDVGLPGFTGPVDIYLGFKMPDTLSPEIWIIMPDLSVQPASTKVAPWKTAVTGPLYDGLYGEFPVSLLPAGRYDLYVLVTPSGRLDAYYLWTTHFTAP